MIASKQLGVRGHFFMFVHLFYHRALSYSSVLPYWQHFAVAVFFSANLRESKILCIFYF